ncbi:MAG: hypothetical protein PUP91_25640 [Rhizonema sp. PD37]|nr:hypothetical protein [Rhizonema sp. PD37]
MNPLPGEHTNSHSVEPASAWSIQETNRLQHSNTEIGEINSLAKVRDILVGEQMREVEKHFTRLEERFVNECVSLRDETRKRLDSLEVYLRKEVESLTERLRNEQAERDEAVKSLVDQQSHLAISIQKKLAEFEEQTAASQRDIREQIFNQSKNTQDDLRQKSEEIMALLQKEYQELRKDKTDRATLAKLFQELAFRISSQ